MKFTKEQLQEMYKDFKEYERERGFAQDDLETYETNQIQPDRQIKDFNYFKTVILPMVKKFQKYTHPPFPMRLEEEYIYNRNDLNYIITHVQNPYLEYEQLKDFDTFAIKIYINIYKKF